MVSKLWTDISSINPWKVVLILVSDWYEKRLNSTVFILYNCLCIDQSPIGNQSELSGPEFSSGDWRTVDNKLLCFFIKSCDGFKTSDIGSMSNLSLGIASNNLIIDGFLKEKINLFWSTHEFDTFGEHQCADRSRQLMVGRCHGVQVLLVIGVWEVVIPKGKDRVSLLE